MKPEPVAIDSRAAFEAFYTELGKWVAHVANDGINANLAPTQGFTDALSELLESVRRAALEEAARVCDDMRIDWAAMHGNPTSNAFDGGYTTALLAAAAAIRALIDKENQRE